MSLDRHFYYVYVFYGHDTRQIPALFQFLLFEMTITYQMMRMMCAHEDATKMRMKFQWDQFEDEELDE